MIRSAYDPTVIARMRGCGCHAPANARNVAERTARVIRHRRVREDGAHEGALARTGADPIVLGAGNGSKCRPFLTVQKDQERFAACNALADSIGPLDSPKRAVKLIREAIGDEVNEVFGIVTLDLHLRMKSIAETGRGEPSAVMAPMVPTLQAALIDGAHAVIITHVHPSGVPAEPSDADKETTEAFADAFDIVGVGLLDHIILGGSLEKPSYFSFLEAGLLPPLPE
jgi:RadC-like JAB domain-containing protein